MWYSIGNSLGPWSSVRISKVSAIEGVHYWRFHCIWHPATVSNKIHYVRKSLLITVIVVATNQCLFGIIAQWSPLVPKLLFKRLTQSVI